MSKQTIKTSGFSLAKGKKLTGDDYFDVKTIGNLTIAIVCDGVGSADEGAEAAKRVTTHLMSNFKNRPLSWSIEKSIKTFTKSINAILYEESMVNYERPELVTTLTIVIIEGNRLYGANVGDSRVYLKREDVLTQLSKDHAMEEEGYEGVLTQAMGIGKEVDPYYFENIINEKDKILLCSDGLYTIMSNNRLENGIENGSHYLVKQASKLMEDNLPDDTTAVTIDILGIDQVEELKQQKLIIPEDLEVGMVIDGYTLEKSLIQNDRTWLCSNKGKNYVLKFAPIEAIESPKILDLFVKEAWNAKRLKAGFFPKSVIPKNRTHRYYVMQLVEGVDLKEYLKKRKLSVEDTINLAKTLLKMNQYLLKFDLVHGDIKPENIMVKERDGKQVFKVIDFGSMTELYSIDSNAGTPSYLAPERFSGSSINESSEIYSIGVTLYESLTQAFPFGEIEPFQTPSFKKVTPLSKYNKNIPSWVSSIIFRAIEKESDLRYKHYSEMMFETTNPLKVKPYFKKGASLLEREPVLFYRSLFTVSFIVNMFLVGYILR
ncbi:MAG: Protein serine/threonine phosphatase PrpC, regulation of stationary phase [uncultured Sulfurovum sp.]|uniref:Protein serine/threonine phosphatase PrpC, regulation of stationary phase n=1 Tax=uncultured Sulfurovum sp. TaxID=269237 RepID=A0A6S6S8M6_9BACT|nr:MAG: Protein serine/threonine phosphatase PrpC, regulation of stationary phase [uncultured Sulfurovum sp.]